MYVKLKKFGDVPEFMSVKLNGKVHKLPFGGVFEVSENQKVQIRERGNNFILSAAFVAEHGKNFEEIKIKKSKEK